MSTTVNKSAFVFGSSKCLWKVLQECWSERIFLAPLLPNFCKLSLQLFAYYIGVWKDPLLNTVKVLNSGTKVYFSAMPLCHLSMEEDLLFAGSDFHVLCEKVSDR